MAEMTRMKKNIIYFLSIILSLIPLNLAAEPAINEALVVDESFQSDHLLSNMIYLEDKNKILSITDIETSLRMKYIDWSKIGEKEISFGFTKSAYWLHFPIKNKSMSATNVYLECSLATMDRVEIFYRDKLGNQKNEILGDIYPFKERSVKFRTLVFRIPLSEEENKSIFLRLENKGPMKVALTLRSAENFSNFLAADQVIIGIYYGMMIVIAIYNLFLYFSIRDSAYIFYILYVVNIASYQFFISGNAAQFLLHDSPDIANRAPNLIANLSFISSLLFTKFFLNTKLFAPRFNRLIEFLIIVSAIFTFIILYVGHDMLLMKTSNLLGLVLILTIIATAVVVYKRGYRPARFFLLGWSFLLLAVFIQILANLGALNLTAENVGQIGSGIEVILLSFALGDRIKNRNQRPDKEEINITAVKNQDPEPTKHKSLRPVFTILQSDYNLTYQQAQVCIALSEGKSRITIAEELNISSNTLKKHLSEIYNKTINRVEQTEIPSQEKLQKLTIFLHDLSRSKH